MNSLVFSILLIGSVKFTEGVIHGECPRLPCPNTSFCKQTAPTYFLHNGMKCPGCDECIVEAPVKKEIKETVHTLHICPMVMCLAPAPCDVPLQTHYMTVGDRQCPMCQFCPKGHATGPSPELIRLKKDVVTCPQLLCLTPNNDCAVPLQMSKTNFNGYDCTGCPYCPTDRL